MVTSRLTERAKKRPVPANAIVGLRSMKAAGVGWGEERTPMLRLVRYVGVPSSPQPTSSDDGYSQALHALRAAIVGEIRQQYGP
jgi:hypothetical protein